MTNDKPSQLAKWIGPIVVVGGVLLIIALLLPAVQQAREAARRTQAKCSLKQIGLALHNYHDTFLLFPPGGVFNEQGTAFHGWTTFVAPYLDCSPFYNSIDMNVPWDDPQQVEKFITRPHPVFQNPSQEPTMSPDGIPLVHFSANQWLLHRNSSRKIKDIENGLSNTIAFGNSLGRFDPLGYPYIWRDPLIPINTSPDGYGYNETGCLVLLADGSVRWIAKDIAAEIHATFAGPEKLRPTAEQVEKPAGEYRLGVTPWKTHVVFKESRLELTVRTDSSGKPVEARMDVIYLKGDRITGTFDDALSKLIPYADVPIFHAGDWFTDDGVKQMVSLKKLETLSLGGKHITDAGAKHLSALPSLRTLTLDQTEITAAGLEELSHLPQLATLRVTEPRFGDDGIKALLHFPQLETLELRWHFRATEATPDCVADLIHQRPNLQVKVRVDGRLYYARHILELVAAGKDWTGKVTAEVSADAERPENVP